MTSGNIGIMETISDLLEYETSLLKAGDLSLISGTAKRKARLLYQLAQSEERSVSTHSAGVSLQRLREALLRNLQSCNENAQALRELVSLQLRMEQELESDGTYHLRDGTSAPR